MPETDNSNKPSILKTTREAKGLTLEIVHEATKIPMDALRAIEEGYSSRILSPFYYRGFIKIYAEFLGLDVAETYTHYGLDQPPKPAATVAERPASRKRTAPVALQQPPQPNVMWEQVQEWFSLIFTPKNLKLIGRIIGALVVLFFFFKMAGCIASHLSRGAHPKHPVLVRQPRAAHPMEEKRAEEAAPVVPAEVKNNSFEAQSENDKVEVAVRADRNTWIQVKADDKVVFQMTLSKGSMENWSADKRIQISGSNLEQLDMEVNGKHVGSLGGGERRIRRVLITKEGLTVKK